MVVVLLVLGLILFISLVVVHEFGHFIVARRNGIEVEEFGIGFPPRAWGKKLKSGMMLSINWLPLGGFVKLKGEHDSDTTKGSYGTAGLGAKSRVMLAGVGMNLLAAFVLLMILAWIGMPKLVDNQFSIKNDAKVVKNDVLAGYIEPDSPAENAGIKQRDQIIAIANEQVNAANELPELTKKNAEQKVEITYKQQQSLKTAAVVLRTSEEVEQSKNTDNPKAYLGIAPTEYSLTRYSWSAPVVAAGTIKQFTVLTFQGLGRVIGSLLDGRTTEASQQVSGPVGIFVLLKDGSILGIEFVLIIIAVISLTLAIMNVLPIPALDGGRLFVTWLFRIIRKPLTKRTEELIHGIGFAVLMALFVLITIVDIKRF